MTDITHDKRALKTTTKALVDACGGPVACKQLLNGKSPSLISGYGSFSSPDRFMPLDDVMELERFAERPIVSAWLYERLQDQPRAVRPLTMQDIGDITREVSEAKLAIIAALSDGRICAADGAQIAKELRDAIEVLSDCLRSVEHFG